MMMKLSNVRTLPIKAVLEAIDAASYEKQNNLHESANAAISKSTKLKKCSNCSSICHNYKSCWAEGGGSALKVPKWWKLKEKEFKAAKAAKEKGKSPQKVNAAISDSDNVQSHLAIELDTDILSN